MSWYITIAPKDPNAFSDTADLVEFLRSIPELEQTGAVAFAASPGSPWISISLVRAKCGSWASYGAPIPTFNCVSIVCSYRQPAEWYDDLASRIAEFLGWVAIEDHENRRIWPPV